MKKHTSIYLDILRFGAAMLVFIYHMGFFSGYRIPYVGSFGSEAVIVFFVLSGLVVSNSADCKHTDIIDYGLSRLARLWSVVFPALVVTLIADKIGQSIELSQYGSLQPLPTYKWLLLLPANALFLNQIWNFNLWPGSNGPFWSISYEFWYYCIFGMAFYFRGAIRIALIICAALVAGPHILLSLPAWLMGVMVYRLIRRSTEQNRYLGAVLFLLSIAALSAYGFWGVNDFLKSAFPSSAAFVKWDIDFWPKTYIVSLLIALNIYGFHAAGAWTSDILIKHQKPIRRMADWTFGLYLFHYPLGYLIKTIVAQFLEKGGALSVVFIYGLTFTLSVGLAMLCEMHKGKVNVLIRSGFHFIVPPYLVKSVCGLSTVYATEPKGSVGP